MFIVIGTLLNGGVDPYFNFFGSGPGHVKFNRVEAHNIS